MGILAVSFCVTTLRPAPVAAQTGIRIGNLCRVKGQEENRLQGLGLVVGLKGTGDGGDFAPKIDLLAAVLQRMGSPIASPAALADSENVALVVVQATIPATGAREGDRIDCVVSSIGGAQSLRGGQLLLSALLGPDPEDVRLYGFANGPVVIDDLETPTSGRVLKGARLEEDFYHLFSLDDYVNLVIDEHRASFQAASEVAYWINQSFSLQNADNDIAQAMDSKNVKVQIPEQYRDIPVDFIAQVLNIQMQTAVPFAEARVVINEKTSTIVISGEVEISPVLIVVEGVTVSTGGRSGVVPVDVSQQSSSNLEDLVTALEAIQVSAAKRIHVIRELEKSGKLHAWVKYE